MHRYPVRAFYVEAVPQASNRAMPGLQDGVFPLAGGRVDCLLADGNERPALALQPVGFGGGGEDRYKVIHSDCLPSSNGTYSTFSGSPVHDQPQAVQTFL